MPYRTPAPKPPPPSWFDRIKAALRNPRVRSAITVITCTAIIWITGKLGPSWGLRGSELRDVLSGQGAIGMLIAWILRSPFHKEQPQGKKKAKREEEDEGNAEHEEDLDETEDADAGS